MVTVTTTAGIDRILGTEVAAFDEMAMLSVESWATTFVAVLADFYWGNFSISSASNTVGRGYSYGAEGTVTFIGTGLLGYGGTLSSIAYNNQPGDWADWKLTGSMRWDVYDGIYNIRATNITIGDTNFGYSMRGNFTIDENGILGTVTSHTTYWDGMSSTYIENIDLLTGTGSISSVVLKDKFGGSITISGALWEPEFSELLYGVNTIDDALKIPEIFAGDDILNVPDGSTDWHGFFGNDKLTGGSLLDRLHGDEGNDVLSGLAGNDFLYGGSGNDTLNGGLGADSMSGGLDDDVYTFDSSLDSAIEYDSEGTDTVIIAYKNTSAIPQIIDLNSINLLFVENVQLLGTGTFNIIGSVSDNILTGNASFNVLDGGDGDDTLNGGLGADRMIGGEGKDKYIVDNAGDVIVEFASGGEDTVESLISYVLGDYVENGTLLGAASINLTGNTEGNKLAGNAGANTIDGAFGADIMAGGKGNDIYLVDNEYDVVTELLNEGTDTVRSSVNYVLVDHVEHLLLTGADNLDGTGNALNNVLTGNAGVNRLEGGGGSDALSGGLGDDLYIVNLLASGANAVKFEDTISESANGGIDTVKLMSGTVSVSSAAKIVLATYLENIDASDTEATPLILQGNAAGNAITGNDANNTLDGLGGVDTLIGGQGDDIYVADSAYDVVLEEADEGIDTLRVTYKNLNSLASEIDLYAYENVENIEIVGTGKFNLIGNEDDNILTGNASVNEILGNGGSDTLDGKAGADTMIGGEGDDTYFADNAGDTIVELSSEGEDKVYSTVSHILGANVEKGFLTGAAAINLTGNVGNNDLTGNIGANTLDGGLGGDTMSGGKGNDIYIVDDVSDVVTELLNEGTDTVRSSITYALGTNMENLSLTGTNDVDGAGNDQNNAIIGNSGANVLEGGAGLDTLSGGLGNDTYIVNLLANGISAVKLEDNVIEAVNGGTDTLQLVSGTLSVNSAAKITLAAYLENIDASATGATTLTILGNAAANSITGNAGSNTLDGLGGSDTLIGGGGDDVYIVDTVNDIIVESLNNGVDKLRVSYKNLAILAVEVNLASYAHVENIEITGTGKFNLVGDDNDNILTGNASVNELTGNGGNDALDGKIGADKMTGGEGDDTYYADNIGDTAIELANEGEDTVYSTISYLMGVNIERGVLMGAAAISLTGNAEGNDLTGNIAGNMLDGGLGADTMTGSKGNDIYIIDNAGDVATELLNEGADTVRSSISYDLASNLENLYLIGTGDIDGIGNVQNNVIVGNSGANVLEGGAGLDALSGGLGNDTYIVNLLASGAAAVRLEDTITEAATGGIDTLKVMSGTLSVTAAAKIVLANYLENLDASGTGATPLTLQGNSAANAITGNAGNNTLSSLGGDDILYGGAGSDVLSGGLGADVFVFDASSLGTIDTITDFSLLQNDKIDLSDYLENYDPLVHAIADFVELTTGVSSNILSVDRDGGGNNFVQVAILNPVSGMSDISELVASGNLVVA